MKRAWPYALALAVVVTGCYLALAPLLRSLTPGPTGAQATPLLRSSGTTTVSATKLIRVPTISPDHGFTALVGKAKTAKKAKKTKKVAQVAQKPVFVQSPPSLSSSTSTGSSPSSSSTTSTTPTTSKPKTSNKTASSKGSRLQGTVGGTVDQADNGGFAGQGNGDSAVTGGKSSTVAGG
jgi:hypothetical protein